MNPPLRLVRPFVFPALLLAALEWWARTLGKGSDTVAPPSAAVQAFLRAATDGSLLSATAFSSKKGRLARLMPTSSISIQP